jgi:hypothetical protein
MPGPSQPWDLSGDPRESTVDLPRLDLAGLADYFAGGPAADLDRSGGSGLAAPSSLGPQSSPDALLAGTELPRRPGLTERAELPRRPGLSESSGLTRPARLPESTGLTRPARLPESTGLTGPARLPEPPGLLEPLPDPDLGRFSTPNRGPEPTAFLDPYASPDVPAQPPPTRADEPGIPAASSPAAANSPPASDPAANASSAVAAGAGPGMSAVANDAHEWDEPAPHEWDEPAPPATASAQPDAIADLRPAQALVSERPPAVAPPGIIAAEPVQRPSTGFGSPDRATAGSHADLRSRLARLPAGHPSSPYDDGGQGRPAPTRLRQLELGVPAPERELPERSAPDISAAAGTDHEPASVARNHADRPQHAESDQAESDRAASAPDSEAGQLAAADMDMHDVESRRTPPHRPSPDDAAVDREAPFPVRNGDGQRSARSEWADPYAHGNGHPADGRPADLALGPWQGGALAPRLSGLEGLSARGGNGHRNGHTSGDRQRATHLGPEPLDRAPRSPASREGARDLRDPTARDAARRDAPDPRDPAGRDAARRETVQHQTIEPGAARLDSRTRRSPEPDARQPRAIAAAAEDLRAMVDRTLASCRTAEGRNVFGSYGSSGLTPAIQRIAAQLPYGGLAPGSEADSLKSPDRLAAKLARLIARYPGRTPEELAAAISDVVRYAFTFETADYVDGTWLVHRRFKAHGFELEARRNRWESPECKGIFTQWRDPAHNLAFEVQFHTTASWAVVQRTYDAYVLITDPATPPAERARLRARQVSAAAAASAPPNWTEIGDFRLDPR